MNPEIKEQWLAALRSGEYEQGKFSLRSAEDKFCCLGVLTDLAVKAGVCEWEFRGFDPYRSGGHDGQLPYSVQDWAAVSGWGALRIPVDYQDSSCFTLLSALNDAGATFLEIADIIEAQL